MAHLTALTTSGVLDLTGTTDSSDASGDTGILRVEGGASIAKKLYIGTDLDVDGTANLDIVDIDGAVNIAAAVTQSGGVFTQDGGAVFNEASADVDFRVESNGADHMLFVNGGDNTVLINGSVSQTVDGDMAKFQVAGTNGDESNIQIVRNNAANGGPTLSFGKSRNTTRGSFTIVNDNDVLGQIVFNGDDGDDMATRGASITARVNGTPGANDMPTELVFATTADGANSVTEQMTITNAGDVGVGLAAASVGATLHVDPATNVTTALGAPLIKVGGANSWAGNGSIYSIGFGYTDSATHKAPTEIGMKTTSASGETKGDIVFATRNDTDGTTSPSEVMRIRADKTIELLMEAAGDTGTTNYGIAFHQNGGSPFYQTFTNGVGNTTILVFGNDNGVVGTIKTNGSATAFNTSSDYRLKENVDYDWDATTRLKQLKPARFNFIADDTNTLVDGFIAHEAATVVPECVSGAKDAMTTEVLYVEDDELPEGKNVGDVKTASVIDPQGIDQSKLVPLLVKTIQELEARITALEDANNLILE